MNEIKRNPKLHPVGRSVTCYFCNECFEPHLLNNHVIQCGAVLEPCPKNCGVYIPRRAKEKHIKECSSRKSRPVSFSDNVQAIDPTYSVVQSPRNSTIPKQKSTNFSNEYLENDLLSLRTAFLEERRYRQELQVEINRLLKLYQKSEEYNKHLNEILETLKRNLFDETEKRKHFGVQLKLEMDKINLQYQVMESWKKQIDFDMQNTKKIATEMENKVMHNDVLLKKHNERLDFLDRMEIDMNMLQQKIRDDQFNRQEETVAWRGELNEFKDFFAQENAMISALWSEQREETAELKKALELQISVMNDFKTKYHTLVFDTKSVTQTAIDTTDKLDSQSQKLKKLTDKVEQLKFDIKSLEQSVPNGPSNSVPTGRLIWKIAEFDSKMEHAKQHNSCLFSPFFNTSLYGYKLRLEVYLNGIKKWRGRHIILSLQVLKGDWDALLIWPCKIEAKVSLRDQNLTEKRDFIKYISAKRMSGDDEIEEPQESSSQYIFISHATLEKQSYIKDDTVFFEVSVVNDNLTDRRHEMTTL